MHLRLLPVALGLALVGGGCGDDETAAPVSPRWIEDVEEELPKQASLIGLWSSGLSPYEDVVDYEPRYPLYSNGLGKRRFVYVPEGATVDAGTDFWEFPVGTVFAKVFLDGETPLETRLLFRRASGWDYAEYRYDESGAEATLLEGNWAAEDLELRDGTLHAIPGRLDCRTCHETYEAAFGTVVLGMNALQADDDVRERLSFAGAVSDAPIEGRTDNERRVLEYFVGNCVTCHNGGEATNAAFSLMPDEAVANTVNVETEAEAGAGFRVVPGNVAESVLYESVVLAPKPGYGGAFKAMPPIGLTRVDPAVAATLEAWILELK